MEIWKKITGYEGLYEVSDCGRVRGKRGVLSKALRGRGYPFVSLWKNNRGKCFDIHRLVAMTFIQNPEKKRTVNHRDGIKENNHISNLEWATDSENGLHSFRVLKRKPSRSQLGKFGFKHNRSSPFIVLFRDGTQKMFGSGLEYKRHTGLDDSSISYARKIGLPHKFTRGKASGLTIMEIA